MNAVEKARSAYSRADAPLGTARDTEYEAFARVTRHLSLAGGGNFAALARALHDNRRLWTALAADVASRNNALPAKLRAQIFYLSEFIRLHSGKVMDGSASLDVLIDINKSIMRGLRREGGPT